MVNQKPSEIAAVIATIDPDAYSAADETPQTSDWFDMSKFECALATIMTGTVAASVTITAKIEQATTSGGTPKDVTGTSITALTTADGDKQVLINLRAEDLDAANNYRWARLSVTIADSASPDAAAADFGAVVHGFFPKYGPASDNDLASVDEIVN